MEKDKFFPNKKMQKKNKVSKTKKTVSKTKRKTARKKSISASKFNPAAILDLRGIKKIETRTVNTAKKIFAEASMDIKVKESKVSSKQFVYIVLSVVAGLLFATLMLLLAELVFVKSMASDGLLVEANNFLGLKSYLPISIEAVFMVFGLMLGIWLGLWGWKAVYIDHKRRS